MIHKRNVFAATRAAGASAALFMVWQLLAQMMWRIDDYPCDNAADWIACKSGPKREFLDFAGFFTETPGGMVFNYLMSFIIMVIAVVVVALIVCVYGWASEAYDDLQARRLADEYRRNRAKDASVDARL